MASLRPGIPPELLQGQVPGAPPPPMAPPMAAPQLGPGFVDGPSEDPMLRQMQAMEGEGVGGMGSPMQGPQGPLTSPLSQEQNPPEPVPAQNGAEAIIDVVMSRAPDRPLKLASRKEKRAKPDWHDVVATGNRDKMRWALTIERMARDVALYRQHDVAKPLSFKAGKDQEVASSAMSTLVNKLANMLSKTDQLINVPYDSMAEEQSAQRIEDALYQLRKLAKRDYALSSGGAQLQRDEFFYLLLHGRYVKRIIPYTRDPRFPWAVSLLDPATCFPTFGGPKNGLIRMVRVYDATVGEMVTTYSQSIPDVERKMLRKLGYSDFAATADYWNNEREVIEYWDDTYHCVTFGGEELVPVMEHGLPRIPFAVTMAVGEPPSMATPGRHYMLYDQTYNAYIPQQMGPEADLAQKGVSVFHYLVNTHRVREMLMTLLYSEVEKATDPPTITYVAQHLGNDERPPLKTKRGDDNERVLNLQDVQGMPTSPRPTDFSPLYSTIQQEFMEGSLSPASFGAEQGSNVTGAGLDTLLNAAKDMILPYLSAWEAGQAMEDEIMLEQYVELVANEVTLTAPEHDPRGLGKGEIHDLTPSDVVAVGTFVEVEAFGMSDQTEAARVATANQAVQAGFWSQRHAMAKLGIKNQDKMFAEIIAEKAMQHPALMENMIIPKGFIDQGMPDMADMWLELVVGPKMMQLAQPMAGDPAAAAGGGAPTPEGGTGSQAVPVAPGQPPDQAPRGAEAAPIGV